MQITFDIEPFAKPRMTQRDKWKKRPVVENYYKFKDAINIFANINKYKPSNPLSIIFVIPMPASWSNKKRESMNESPHLCRPDLSNLIKAFEDCLMKEDSTLWHYGEMKKIWGFKGKIIITIP